MADDEQRSANMGGVWIQGGGVTIKGSSQDLRGLHADRPAADAVPVGTTYWSVDEPALPGTVFVSDGTSWGTVEAL